MTGTDEIIHAAPETAPDALGDAPTPPPEGWPEDLPEPPAGPTPLELEGFRPAADPKDYAMPSYGDALDREGFEADQFARQLMHEFRLPTEIGSSLAQMVNRMDDPSTDSMSDGEFSLAWQSTRADLVRRWGQESFDSRLDALRALVKDVDSRTDNAASEFLDMMPGLLVDPMTFQMLALHAERWLASQPKARQK